MGLYDSFILDHPLDCPTCHAVDSGLDEFQTKELGEWFCSFKQGEAVVFNRILQLLDGAYPAYACCNKCETWVDADVRIQGGVFVGLENIRFKPQQ